MGRPRTFDPEDVLDRSMREFWRRGFRDTSVEDLVAATGVRPGSLYAAFPGGKRELFMSSLDRYSKLVVPEKLGELGRPGASLPELRAYFDGLVADLLTPEGRVGCLLVNSAVELAAEDHAVSEVASRHMARLESNARRALQNAKRCGQIRKDIDVSAKAQSMVATAMGLMVVGKTAPGKEALERIVDAAFADLT